MKLTYYLFNKNIKSFEQQILPNKIGKENNYDELEVVNKDLKFETKVFIQRNKTKQPKWITFLEDDLRIPNKDDIRNTVNSFVILVKINKNGLFYFFAITGGFGFTAINRNNIESNFGLKVALNTIDSKELKAFDVRNIDLKTKQKRVLINKGSEVGEFDLNFEQDLVNLVSGKSRDEQLGTSIKGSNSSLSLSSNVTFSELGEKCNQILDLYLSNDYKENFGFIDNIKLVKDSELNSTLNRKLFEAICKRETHDISLAYPDMIEYEKCSYYKLKKGFKEVITEEVSLKDLYLLLEKDNIQFESPDKINKIKIIGFDDTDSPVTSAVSLNHFLIFQTEIKGDTFIFSLNNWYKIDNDYFDKVQKEIMSVPLLEDKDFLTGIYMDESEGSYNERQNPDYFLSLDKQNFQVQNSRSKIEVCDLLSADRHFVCVKKETRSATLSHLFAQGSVSMQLLRESKEYREYLLKQAIKKFPAENFNVRDFPYNECTLVYAISTNKTKDIRDVLPFFSKVNLIHHIKLIKRLGIKVEICKIPVLNKQK
ncbi:DUF6119 family protein [uncultured Exiguobacterium sp.]|uniref:DUF6119 family protein n=1 Tax=uncultured Exiguobacterium sp. TaxID=202669 RepID=UPI0025FC19BC|nr:DUF6119 family protein [uncultured Exiguobacterium sp.]